MPGCVVASYSTDVGNNATRTDSVSGIVARIPSAISHRTSPAPMIDSAPVGHVTMCWSRGRSDCLGRREAEKLIIHRSFQTD